MMPITPQLVRFGAFELDLNTGELVKNGRRLKLQQQPFRLLTILLEQPGQAVTRSKLKEALWPSDTFVDFDHSLNAAVAKLRQALGDSAENPRFIETVAKRGYRFIAPVSSVLPATIDGLSGPDALARPPVTALNPMARPSVRLGTTTIAVAAISIVGIVVLAAGLRSRGTHVNAH